jgi:hypothetical protein
MFVDRTHIRSAVETRKRPLPLFSTVTPAITAESGRAT